MTTDLVISHYREGLEWVRPLGGPGVRLFVYNKNSIDTAHPESLGERYDDFEEMLLENRGFCDGSYLYHIVTHWDDLADWTVFSTDNPHDHLPEGVVLEDVLVPGSCLRVPRLWKGRDWDPVTGRLNWQHWGNLPKRVAKVPLAESGTTGNFTVSHTNWKAWYESGKVTPAALSFVEFARRYAGVDVNGSDWPGYAPGGTYGVPKKAITYLPKIFYERLLGQANRAVEGEEAHYLERLWPSVWSGIARYIPEETCPTA